MKKRQNLRLVLLISVLFATLLGVSLFFNSSVKNNAVDIKADVLDEEIKENSIISFFEKLFEKKEDVLLSPGEVLAPTNEKVLCLYNINSVLSNQICEYYLLKRPGAKSLGLNVLDSNFLDQFKEVMNYESFYQKVVNPVLSYGEQHPEITHIAIAKDLPLAVIEGGQRYSAISYFFTPYRYIGSSPAYVGANSTFNFTGDQMISYANRGVYFNASNYLNSSGGYTTRFVASHLTAYTLEDVKKMIEKSVDSPSQKSSWLIDKDPYVSNDLFPTGFSISDDNVFSLNTSLQERNISSNFITINADLSILQAQNPIIGYVGPGIYHTGYSNTYVTNPNLFNLQVNNRAIYSTIESYAAYTASGDPSHINMENRAGSQSKIADAFSANAFGGTNYNNSFSGAVGALEEPGQAAIMTSTLYLFRNYAQGLTLAESLYMNQRSPITLFGDPLMQISEAPLKYPIGAECNNNYSCLSSFCEKDTFNVSRCQQLPISCMTPRNYDILIEKEQTSKCLNYTNTIVCSSGQFIPQQTCSLVQYCSEKIVNGIKSASCLSINGELCSQDSDCTSNKCGLDLQGQKRCVNTGSCSIGDKKGEVSSGKFACISDSEKKLCANGLWSSSVSCQGLCSNGLCEEERNWFVSPDRLNLKGEEFYPLYLNLNNNNRSVSNLFSNFSNGDSIFYYVNGTFQSASFFLGGLSRDFVLKSGQGILIKTSANRTLLLNGTAFNSAPEVELNDGFNLVGIGYCSSKYTAKSAIEEIYLTSPNCSLIIQHNIFGGPNEYWSVNESYSQNGLKRNFKIYEYEPFSVKCISNTSFTWQPSCMPPDFCEPNSVIACDNVSNAEVTGYKNKCNSLGTAYLNESTCIAKKYLLARNDFNVSVESSKKVLRDNNNNVVIKIPSVLDNSVLDSIDVRRSNRNESKEFVIVKELDLPSGQTKSISLQRKNSNSNAVCIRDESNLNNANDIKTNCFKVRCPGHVGDYNCTVSGNTFEVSGLQNSGVIEDRLFCGDNLCSEGESCSSCANDCGLCVGSGGNSGSSGSGSGSNSGGSGSGGNSGNSSGGIAVDESSSRKTNISSNTSQDNSKIKSNAGRNSEEENSTLINYSIGLLIFIAVTILIILFTIFIRTQKTNYVPDRNNSIFDRKEY